MNEKNKWIIRWKPAILSSRARAKKGGVNNTKTIWEHLGYNKKPKQRVNNDHKRQNKQHKEDLKRQQNIALKEITEVEGFNIVGKKRSTSRYKPISLNNSTVQKDLPSVISLFKDKNKKEHSNKKEPDDRFGDGWNE